MNAYVYNADLLCEECADQIDDCSAFRCTDRCRSSQRIEQGCDSDCCPQGPYSNGAGESDSPSHCGACGAFLENPLTDDGRAYVADVLATGLGVADVLETWAAFYDLPLRHDVFGRTGDKSRDRIWDDRIHAFIPNNRPLR